MLHRLWLHVAEILSNSAMTTVLSTGKVAGRFYDSVGAATTVLLAAQSSINDALSAKQHHDARQRIFPPCNSRWSDAEGSTVWCSTKRCRYIHGVPNKKISYSLYPHDAMLERVLAVVMCLSLFGVLLKQLNQAWIQGRHTSHLVHALIS